jgi:hypothetical protein
MDTPVERITPCRATDGGTWDARHITAQGRLLFAGFDTMVSVEAV